MTNEPPEEVGWSHHAQDVAEAEEAARVGENPALETPQAMRNSLPLGRFLLRVDHVVHRLCAGHLLRLLALTLGVSAAT